MFSSDTTLDEAIKADLSTIDNLELMKLKKSLLCDIIREISRNKLSEHPQPLDSPVIPITPNLEHQNLLEQILSLQGQLKKHEDSIVNLVNLESEIINKIKDVQKNESYHPNGHVSVEQPKLYENNYVCDPYTSYTDNYVEETVAKSLIEFCNKQQYTPENGHSVVMFGEKYQYSLVYYTVGSNNQNLLLYHQN